MNHGDTRTKRTHEDNFVFLSAFESLWFKFKLPTTLFWVKLPSKKE